MIVYFECFFADLLDILHNVKYETEGGVRFVITS